MKDPRFDPDAEGALASYLDAARAARPQPSDDLVARLVADARGAQPRAPLGGGIRAASRPSARSSELRRILGALGGWAGLGGLGAAGLAGLWIGFAAPGPLAGVAGSLPAAVLGGARGEADLLLVELTPDFGDYLTEG